MRIHYGPVPAGATTTETDWHRLRLPGPILLQMVGVPLGLAVGAVLLWVWLRIVPFAEMDHAGAAWLSVCLLALLPVHELLHAAFHPTWGTKSVLGIWPGRLLLYAHYDGPLSRVRLLAIYVMPFLGLTVLPLAFSVATGWASDAGMFVSVLNGIGCGGDMVGFFLLLAQVPRKAVVQNQGWDAYWRTP